MREKIVAWIKDFVEKPNELFNNWPPCPYARKARLDNKVEIVEGTDVLNDGELAKPLLESKDVIIFYYNSYDKTKFVEDVNKLNDKLLPLDYVVLEDHPDIKESINGLTMNFGLCPLLFVQRLSKLNQASDQLKSTDYYNHWSKENLDNVVTWRYNHQKN